MSETTRFGDFFRQRRTALGLSLREFCRRNGFDPGNVSRLERGLTAPPQTGGLLEQYAKALKLEPASLEWDTFHSLAVDELEKRLPKLRRGSRHRNWITALDLETRWAGRRDAQSRLPQVIRRLISATTNSIERVHFPAGKDVQRPGWDGVVETSAGNAFVPKGLSGWELSVEKDSRSKAESDFQHRVKDSRGLDRSQMSFVYVTPRKWANKDMWCADKKKLGIWRDVRVYDSSDLEQWLETAPGTDIWLAELLHLRPVGVTSIDHHWANLSAIAGPHFDPKVFLVSRTNERDLLHEWLKNPANEFTFQAPSVIETLDFVAAVLASLDETERDALASTIVVVKSREQWEALCANHNRLILIPAQPLAVEAEMVAEAVRQGHNVVDSKQRFPNERSHEPCLSFVDRRELEDALVASGFEQKKASELSKNAGGSLSVLKRLASRFDGFKEPEWARPDEALGLVPVLLAGGWDDTYDADRRVIEKLGGRSYEEILSVATRWLNAADPPITRFLSRWSLVSRLDSWFLLASHITRQHLDVFEEVAGDVLGETDPRYELPPDARWRASLLGKVPKYSDQLRSSVAETLALMGAKSDALSIRDSVGPARRAERVVRRLFADGTDWKRWASLSRQLPTLAEASPDAFLDSVENELRRNSQELIRLFADEGVSMFSSCNHAGLLWALETLAWSPSLLTRVCLILARLAQRDPGQRRTNRPINSLQEIFLPWLPHTAASVDERIRVLNVLATKEPEVAWRLLLSLLPTLHGVSTPTHDPAWRDWATIRIRGVTNAEYWRQIEACAPRLAEMVGTDSNRWIELIERIENFPAAARTVALKRLREFDVDSFGPEGRQEISDALREKVSRHRCYSDAQRAMPSDSVDELAEIQQRFEPQDHVRRFSWLFGRHPHLPNESRDDPRLKRDEVVFERRKQALQAILDAGGLPPAFELALAVEYPYSVGFVLGKAKMLASDDEILPDLLTSDDENLAVVAQGYAGGRASDAGSEWVERQPLPKWTAEQAARFLILFPFERRNWDLVDRLGGDVSDFYWKHVYGYCHGGSKEDVAYAVSMFLNHDRPLQAVNVLSMALHQKCEVDSSALMETLEAGLKPDNENATPEPVPDPVGYEIQKLFETLQSDSDVDVERLASLEWGYLRLLDGHGASPKTLHRLLRTNPKFFADLLSVIFRSDEEPEASREPPSDEERVRGENAYRLLMEWKSVPGWREDDSVDEQELLDWVTQVRELCEISGHLGICDEQIGQVLAHAPYEPDGSWPCIPVRDIIDEVESHDVVRGFELGILNKRPVVTKSPTEGGRQEHDLAQRYVGYAEACDIEWPTTASALRRIAEHYEEYARREDEEAQERSRR